ncbi:hypothetical protein PhCBS80983_g04026 [Powellomyces hirtus]|uniref:Phosphatidylinositol N-acetylglucosaminyltransferase n=1 Tax=Powellomyces hirtus TaxID=109895 RepID=A0A507E230_9FUNG|nr:hypothetical protein PhCBS80983_g04026 [Powellomyces hirtus]
MVPAGCIEALKTFLESVKNKELPPKVVGICDTACGEMSSKTLDSLKRYTAPVVGFFHLNDDGVLESSSYYRGPSRIPCGSTRLIFFSRANSRALQYYSLEPLMFDISTLRDALNSLNMGLNSITNGVVGSKRGTIIQRKAGFAMKAQEPSVQDWELTLHQINLCGSVHNGLNRHLSGRRPLHRVSDAIHNALSCQMLQNLFNCLVAFLRLIALTAIWFFNARFPPWLFQGAALKDISATAQQIDLRLQQTCFWPQQYQHWRRTPNKLSKLAQARYIGFYNTVWLIANDVLFGIALGTFLMENSDYFAQFVDEFIMNITVGTARSMISWLMGSPAGLKLNAELNGFLGEMFLSLLSLWSGWTQLLRPNLSQVIAGIGISSFLGVSMCVSLFMDLGSLVSLHLHLCYVVASKLYFWQVKVIVALFTLFRGKKKNTEKNRIDSVEYGLDQLLLGTILFTLLIFLFPTVAVYYVLFSLIRVTIVILHGAAEIALGVVNHFPLFAIMLRLKDPQRLPAGITLDVCSVNEVALPRTWFKCLWSGPRQTTSVTEAETPRTVRMVLKNAPLEFSSIFYQYKYLSTSLRAHYLLTDIVASFFTGRNIQAIPRLQEQIVKIQRQMAEKTAIATRLSDAVAPIMLPL